MVDKVQLNNDNDRVRWRIGRSGKFSVKDLYFHLRSGGGFPAQIYVENKGAIKSENLYVAYDQRQDPDQK